MFRDSGMIYLVGSGGSDYLDFVGDTHDHATFTALSVLNRGLYPRAGSA